MKKNTERLTVLIDPYTKQRLGQSADEEDKTTSQIIRGLIKLYLVDAEARRGGRYRSRRPRTDTTGGLASACQGGG